MVTVLKQELALRETVKTVQSICDAQTTQLKLGVNANRLLNNESEDLICRLLQETPEWFLDFRHVQLSIDTSPSR